MATIKTFVTAILQLKAEMILMILRLVRFPFIEELGLN